MLNVQESSQQNISENVYEHKMENTPKLKHDKTVLNKNTSSNYKWSLKTVIPLQWNT